ncbi:MAG: hypothetical protein U1F83_04205 [Verrucomicrobiota bacterium]
MMFKLAIRPIVGLAMLAVASAFVTAAFGQVNIAGVADKTVYVTR